MKNIFCVVAVAGLLALFSPLLVAASPAIQGFSFEWRYADRGGVCILIQKTDDAVVAGFCLQRPSPGAAKSDLEAVIELDKVKEIHAALSKTLDTYNKDPRPRNNNSDNIIVEVGEYKVTFDRSASQPRFVMSDKEYRSNGLNVAMDLSALEHYVKILPGLPAAVKLVDERINAAVK